MKTNRILQLACAGSLFFIVFTSMTHAQDSLNVTKLGEFYSHWSSTQDVAVSGDYAYVVGCGGTGLRIIDVSNPVNPIEAGYCLFPDYAYGVDVSGNYAYVANNSAGLRIIDISNPSNPVMAGILDTPGHVHGVTVSGDYAYIANYDCDMYIADISDPANPVEIGFCEVYASPEDIALSGDYAYIAQRNGLSIVDVSDPANPFEVSYCTLPGIEVAVAVAGRYAYLAAESQGMRVVDVTDPEHPYEVGFYDPSTTFITFSDVTVSGNFAYLATGGSSYIWEDGVRIVDISNPYNPNQVGYCYTLGYAQGIALSGNYAFVASQSWGMNVVDISNPYSPTSPGYLLNEGAVFGVAVSGDYAYVADDIGLGIVDISEPNNPVETSYFETPGAAGEVAVSGNYAYLADSEEGLLILDISNPLDPVQIYCIDRYEVFDIVIAGNYAYLASWALVIFDISDPYHPVEAGSYNVFPGIYGMAVQGDYAYISSGSIVQIFDISDPADIFPVSTFDPGFCIGLAVSGDYVYATNQFALCVVDVSNPFAPVQVGICDLPSCTNDVAVRSNYAYVVAEGGGLRIVDVSDPVNPVEAGYYDTIGNSIGVTVSGDYIYVADYNNMGIYQFSIPNLSITMTPMNPPIQIPAGGGSFDFNVTITNIDNTPLVFDAWIFVTLPDGSQYGPIINVSGLVLVPNYSINRNKTQIVPPNAPAGVYYYKGYAGIYPNQIWAQDYFEFTKLGAQNASKPNISE